MALKFYLHRATTSVSGTLPSTTAVISASAPTWTPGQTNSVAATPLLTNRVMDATISAVAQTSQAYTTDNVTTNQQQPMLRWVSPPLQAQVISSQSIWMRIAGSVSSTVSNLWVGWTVAVWRPSNGSLVGRLHDSGGSGITQIASTSQFDAAATPAATTSVTTQAGDVLVVEIWRASSTQTMATSYTNTFFYDGRTAGSTTDYAASLDFTDNVALASDVAEPDNPIGGVTDDFEGASINAANWAQWGVGTQQMFKDTYTRSGCLMQQVAGNSTNYVGVVSQSAYDLTNKAVTAQFAFVTNPTTGSQMYLRCEIDANNAVIIGYDNGTYFYQHQIASTTTTVDSWPRVANSIAFRLNFDNAQNRLWWDIYLPTGWSNRGWEAIPIATTALKITLGTGCYIAMSQPGFVTWDRVNLPIVKNLGLSGAVVSAGATTGVGQPTRRRSITAASAGVSTAVGVVSVKVIVYKDLVGSSGGTSTSNATPTRRRPLTAASAGKTVIGPAATPYNQVILADSPYLYWRLGEASGSTAEDATGNGHTGIYSLPIRGQAGAISGDPDTAVFARTTSECVFRSDEDPLRLGGDFTLETWWKKPAGGHDGVTKQSQVQNGWSWRLSVDAVPFFAQKGGTVWQSINATNIVPNDGLFHHVVVARSGSTITHYLDGVANGSGTFNGTPITTFENMYVGYNSNLDLYGGGYWDEFAVYVIALNATQVSTHYAANAGAPPQTQISVKKSITGSAAGVATTVAAPTVLRRLVGSAAGVSTEIGQPVATRALTGNTAGKTTTSGQVIKLVYRNITGTAAGATTEVGQPSARRSVAGASVGVASTIATPSRRRSLTVSSTGVATVSATISRRIAIVATSVGRTTVAVTVNVRRLITGSSAGKATATGFVTAGGATVFAANVASSTAQSQSAALAGGTVFASAIGTASAQEFATVFRTGSIFQAQLATATAQSIPLTSVLGGYFPAQLATGTGQASVVTVKTGVSFVASLATTNVSSPFGNLLGGALFQALLSQGTAQENVAVLKTGNILPAAIMTASGLSSIGAMLTSTGWTAQTMQSTIQGQIAVVRGGTLLLAQQMGATGLSQNAVMRVSVGWLAATSPSSVSFLPAGLLAGARITLGLMSVASQTYPVSLTTTGIWLAVRMQATADSKVASVIQSNRWLADVILVDALTYPFTYTTGGVWLANPMLVNAFLREGNLVLTYDTRSRGPVIIYSKSMIPSIVNSDELVPVLYRKDTPEPIIINANQPVPALSRKDNQVPVIMESREI